MSDAGLESAEQLPHCLAAWLWLRKKKGVTLSKCISSSAVPLQVSDTKYLQVCHCKAKLARQPYCVYYNSNIDPIIL